MKKKQKVDLVQNFWENHVNFKTHYILGSEKNLEYEN